MEKFARERLVDDGHMLRIRAVRVGKGTSHQDRNLQCSEVVRRYIHLTRHDRLSRFLPIDYLQSGVQSSFIRQTQADSGMLHTRDLPHRQRAFIEQLSKGRRVVISGIIQRSPPSHHPSWAKSSRQILKVNQAAYKQPRGGQQHHRQGDLTDNQRLP